MTRRAAASAAVLLSTLTVIAAAEPPARRIVSLAPNVTEIVYAAGAGDYLVGAVEYSDYPPAAARLPRIGDAFRVDEEVLASLDPDLVLAWGGGTPVRLVENLAARGYRVVELAVRGVDDVAGALRKVGDLAGTEDAAEAAARDYLDAMDALAANYGQRPPLRVFFQISARPLYTVNGEQPISDLIAICGGRNVFGELRDLAPVVSVEAVVAADPEVMIAPGVPGSEPLAGWRDQAAIAAVRDGNLCVVDGDRVTRAAPRMVEGAREICACLEHARGRRDAGGGP